MLEAAGEPCLPSAMWWCQKSQRPETSVVRPQPGLVADQHRRHLAAVGSSHLAPIAAHLPSREVIRMGRRDLIRRERAKRAAVEARDAAGSGPAEPLPAWLGTGGEVASSESTWVRSAPARTTSTQQPQRPAPRRDPSAQRRTYGRPPVPPFEGAPLRELVRRRDEARATLRALDAEIANEVERARALGAPWTAIAQCLAITR